MNLTEQKKLAAGWFKDLRDRICAEFETIEAEYGESGNQGIRESGKEKEFPSYPRSPDHPITRSPATFTRKSWEREGGGGGVMSLMKGDVFEKVGVNISTVHGEFSESFRKEIPGAEQYPQFWASGISLVAHPSSPLVPAVHMNTRMISLGEGAKLWFGGGSDLNPAIENADDTAEFHAAFKTACDKFDLGYYPKYKQWCDEYFFIKHRGVARGVGGIFYDQHDSGDWQRDFDFTRAVGVAFLEIYPKLVRKRMRESWTPEQREQQLIKRGHYAEFNLLYDRGTKFGLQTGGNTEAILMSLPPEAKWA